MAFSQRHLFWDADSPEGPPERQAVFVKVKVPTLDLNCQVVILSSSLWRHRVCGGGVGGGGGAGVREMGVRTDAEPATQNISCPVILSGKTARQK